MTQGGTLSPTIFNVVVDSVVRHWELLIVGEMGGYNSDDGKAVQPTEGQTIRGRYDGRRQVEEGHVWLKVQAVIFNADNRMVASADLGWIWTVFNTLTRIFGRVGLQTNVQETVGMVCQP